MTLTCSPCPDPQYTHAYCCQPPRVMAAHATTLPLLIKCLQQPPRRPSRWSGYHQATSIHPFTPRRHTTHVLEKEGPLGGVESGLCGERGEERGESNVGEGEESGAHHAQQKQPGGWGGRRRVRAHVLQGQNSAGMVTGAAHRRVAARPIVRVLSPRVLNKSCPSSWPTYDKPNASLLAWSRNSNEHARYRGEKGETHSHNCLSGEGRIGSTAILTEDQAKGEDPPICLRSVNIRLPPPPLLSPPASVSRKPR